MTDIDDRTSAVERIAAATKGLDPDAQRYALRAVRGGADPLQAATSVERAARAVQALPISAQVEAMAAIAAIPSPDAATTNRLWRDIVIGLLVLLGVSLIGLITMIGLNRMPDMLVTAFTAILTGTLGLFAPSPTGAKAN